MTGPDLDAVSVVPGIDWPAIPDARGAMLLAMQYQFEGSQWWQQSELERAQLGQLGQVLRHARETVPFYADRLRDLDIANLTMERFRALPLLHRRDIQDAGDSLASTAVPAAHGRVGTTQSSGSTAEPVVTRTTDIVNFFWAANLLREHLWFRRDFSGRLATLRSAIDRPGELPGWGPVTDSVVQTGPAFVQDVALDVDEQLDWLAAIDPDYLLTFATNARALALRALARGLPLPRLREVRTYAETLSPDVRELVRAAWGVSVTDAYSCQEAGYIALQCPEHEHYHVMAETLLVEVLDDAGRPCAPGEVGRVVFTTLHNFAMPLIRCANGDYAEVGEPCPCGRGLPVLKRIMGRTRNMLVLPDGTRHWPSFPTKDWLHIAPIRQIQLVQDAIDHVTVRVVTPRELTGDETHALIGAMQACLAFPLRITVQRVDTVERTRGGKFEDFMSRIAQA